jgi:ribose transport system permease protein
MADVVQRTPTPTATPEEAEERFATGVATPTFTGRRLTRAEHLVRQRELGILIAALGMFVLLSIFSDKFLTVSNVLNVARQISILAIVACGMTYLFVSGELDLSVGSAYAMAAIVFGLIAVKTGADPAIAVLGTVLFGALVGLVNGVITTKIGIPSFIVTLGMLSIMRGGALLASGGWPIQYNQRNWFTNLISGNILVTNNGVSLIGTVLSLPPGTSAVLIPMQILCMVVVVLVSGFILARTQYGYHVYATGGNREAAKRAGINTDRVKITNFVLTGALVGLAASILVTWLNTANPDTGVGFELDVIAAVIIGGTNLFGGAGSIFGTFLGAAIAGMISNGLVLLGASAYFEGVAKGTIIIAAVALDIAIRSRQK